MAKVKISIRIDKELVAEAQIQATIERRSMSAILVNWILEAVNKLRKSR